MWRVAINVEAGAILREKETWRGDCECGGVTNFSKRKNVDWIQVY